MSNATDAIRERIRERLADQRKLVARLLALREQLPGSLLVRWAECGKPACVCHTGRRHGPYYVLSNRSGGQGAFAYLDGDQARRARALVSRSREYRRGLQRLRKLNLELVVLLRRYQRRQLKTTGRRLGVAAARA
jgi:hypothetical protein